MILPNAAVEVLLIDATSIMVRAMNPAAHGCVERARRSRSRASGRRSVGTRKWVWSIRDLRCPRRAQRHVLAPADAEARERWRCRADGWRWRAVHSDGCDESRRAARAAGSGA